MKLPFEISDATIDGLKLLNNKINEDITKKLIVTAVKQLLVKAGPALPSRAEVYESSIGVEAKQADFAVCSILLLASQHSLDDIRPILEFHKINNQTIEQITECYEKFKIEIAVKLAKQGNSHDIQHVTSIAVEIQTASDELQYRINLQTFDPLTGQNKTIQEMFCNQEELQSLINKLKDVERHCDRISK